MDTQTLYLSLCATLITLSGCMIYYSYSRKTYPGFGIWATASILSASSIFLLALRNILPDVISIIGSNVMAIVSMFLFYLGFKIFTQEKLGTTFHFIFIFFYSLVLFPVFTYVIPDLSIRIFLSSISTAIYFSLCGLVHYRTWKRKVCDLNKQLIVTLLLIVILRLFRAVMALQTPFNTTELMSAANLYAAMVLVLNILSISFIVCLMQLNSQRLETENVNVIDKLQAALDEIKTLKGIIPICSHCKRIRDDQGCWNKIEAYIQDHTEAEFSHGICQECEKKHYPDMDIYEE